MRFSPKASERFSGCGTLSLRMVGGGAFRGVACRCFSGDGRVVGASSVPDPYVDATVPDAVFVHGFNYEMWGMNVTAALREYPMPEVEGLKFYPEIILWDRMSKRYMTRYFDTPLRIIYDDQENKTTAKVANTRYRENYYLWLHYLNDLGAYFGKSPKTFLKAAVGVIRDGLLSERRLGDVLSDIGPAPMRALALAGLPVAWVLAKTGK